MNGKFKIEGKKGIILVVVMLFLVVGYYFYLSNRDLQLEEDVEISETQELLLRDLERNYPPSPKEVVKYYFEITKCLYNVKNSEEDVEALGLKLEEIFDEELVENQVQESYSNNLKTEISLFQATNRIVNYNISSSIDVDYFDQDGDEWARLYGTFYIQANNKLQSLEDVFILRKDENGHWKIYGWQQIEEQVTQE